LEVVTSTMLGVMEAPVFPPYDFIAPVTVVPDRYGGTYSQGSWLAFPCDAWDVPRSPFEDDVTAATFWSDAEHAGLQVGLGTAPSAAHDDLVRRLEAIAPIRTHGPKSEGSGPMSTWEIRWPGGRSSIIDRCWRGAGSGPPS
jgi:hypothetical protein